MSIPGLFYQDNVLDEAWEKTIVEWIDKQPWNTSLKRRTQHYGYEYNYRSKVAAKPTNPLSGPILNISDWIKSLGIMNPQQCIINEYFKDQGIAAHIDSSTFGPMVMSISLLEPCNMIISKDDQKVILTLAPRSLLVLSGEVRTQWKHEIKPTTMVQMTNGLTYIKSDGYRRISLTYRTLA